MADVRWQVPTPRVREAIGATAERFAEEMDLYVAEAVAVVLAASPRLGADAALAAGVEASIRADAVRWINAQRQHPGSTVPLDVPPDALDLARDLVRHGIDLQHLATGYRNAQNAATTRWVAAAAAVSEARDVVQVIEVGLRAIYRWVDGLLAGILEQIERERNELTGGIQARRLETVLLLLDGAPISHELASERLRYDLGRRHTGLVVWSRGDVSEQAGAVEKAARWVAHEAGAPRPLLVQASATMAWAWLVTEANLDLDVVRSTPDHLPDGVRVAIGNPHAGAAGFRRSHREAAAAHDLARRRPDGDRLIAYEDVRVAVLASRDEEQARQFVADTLGRLASTAPELRETLRVYLQEDANAGRASERLFTHRNTVLNRIARVDDVLPRPLTGRRLSVALALELLHWLGEPLEGA